MTRRKVIPPSRSRRALIQAGTPIYDSIVADLSFDPAEAPDFSHTHILRDPVDTPKAVAKRVSRKTPKNPKVTV